ncbi:DUF3047 domain-containing protein [Magnetovibrio sp. PR-2]|uniref:DUF3047 domain-containing protein n=1 Tax=Magnetovibrio sp. PR-2 TaxID=3120356 RepID=UPI002FCE4A7A
MTPHAKSFVWAALAASLAVLSACSHTSKPAPRQPSPEGYLDIMSGYRPMNLNAPPGDWVIIGREDAGVKALSMINLGGVHTLELRSARNPLIAVRQVNAMMLATPFLGWSWNVSNHGEGIHPVRLIIGFKGGVSPDDETSSRSKGLPLHDRAIALVWGDTALRRGAFSLPPTERPFEAPVYTVRGGRENTRQWWSEAVDLSDLYKQAWPQDNHRRVRIAFIGLAAAATPAPVRGRVTEITLTH